MAIRSQIPRLKKNESADSFKARVKAWEQRTGKKYPTAGLGIPSDEQRILRGDVQLNSKFDTKQDYSTGKEGEKWRDEVSDLARKNLRIQKSLETSEALQDKVNADRRAGKLSNIPAPKEELIEAETGGWDEVEGGQPSASTQSNAYLRSLGIENTKKYQKEKEEQELYSGWHKSQQADRMESKGLTIEPIQEQKGKNKTTPKSTGTSLEKKFEKIYGKRKMKRFNQVYGKLNLSDRMRRHLLMSKAFRDM